MYPTPPATSETNPPFYTRTQHLVARSESDLAETQRAAEAVASPDGLRVWTHAVDLGELDTLGPRLIDMFEAVRNEKGMHLSCYMQLHTTFLPFCPHSYVM